MDAVEEIKARLAIEDVVGEYVELKRTGRNFKALSPFTSERTPSFLVSPEKQIWHDFSSGKGGDVFGFVMEVEGLDFKGALELLARKAGVDLEQYGRRTTSDRPKQKDRLLAALEAATHFYQVQLTKHPQALAYVREKRAFTKQTILDFRLGYSPDHPELLRRYLLGKGFTDEDMKRAGLITMRRGGYGDMFRGRIMVPLCDPQGAVVGFTARLLAEADAPKYINTPATPLYDKGRHVYGLHLAKESIRKSGFVVVVEGNLDVIASHQAGVKQVVATAGTAMTAQHLKTLKRFSGDIRLCFDQDKAGQSAAERAIDLAAAADVALSMITIPIGKDPDELIRQNTELWQEAIQKPQYVIDWLMQRYEAQLDLSSGLGKKNFTDVVLKLVRRLRDTVEQDHYLLLLSKKLEVSPAALRQKLHSEQETAVPRKRIKAAIVQSPQKERIRLEQHLLALALHYIHIRPLVLALPDEIFVETPAKTVAAFLREHPQFDGSLAEAQKLKECADYVRILSLLTEELYPSAEGVELQYQAERLAARMVQEYVKHKKQQLITQLEASPSSVELLQQVKALDDFAQQYRTHS